MKEPDWDRIQEIYHEALKLPGAERRKFVEQASEGDPSLTREVMELLAVDDRSFLEIPIVNLSHASGDNLVGETINGRYFIEKELGGGGMSQVYLARDGNVNDRPVVVKVLSRDLVEQTTATQKFEQEVEALLRINHSGVVDVVDKGSLDDARPYFVMQFINGENLRPQIQSQGMNLERAASILRQIGAALNHVHENGVFHRDLKPENIMLRRGTDSVVLIDFGIAKVIDSLVGPTTTDAQSAGTLMYMSPEQLRGEQVTAASDIYSMAVIAYEIVTGRRPFDPASAAQLRELQRGVVKLKPKDLRSDLPSKAQQLILRGLEFKHEARYQNAKQFGDNLAQTLVDSELPRKNKRWLKILTTVLVVTLISFGIYKYANRSANLPPNRSFNYFLTIQKMREGKPYQDPFRSHGDDTYENGDRFRLTVSTPVSAYLYIFNERSPEPNETSFKLIYPNQLTDTGSASLGANQSVQSDWITFKGPAGTENFWIVWSTSPVGELDSVISGAFKHPDGGITGQTLVAIKQYLTSKKAEIDATTYNYNANQTAVVRARRDLLVTLEQFKHR